MNPCEELGGAESLLWTKAQHLCSVSTALHQPAAKIAIENPEVIARHPATVRGLRALRPFDVAMAEESASRIDCRSSVGRQSIPARQS